MNKTSTTLPHALTLALAVTLLAACGGTDDGPSTTTTDRTTYPTANIGTTTGTVLADLSFIQPDGSPLKTSDIYKDEKNKLLLVSTSAGWCTACIAEQPALISRHNQWSSKGLYILITTFEDANFVAADAAFAAQWKRQYDLPFAVVADTPFVFDSYYDSSLTPMNMIVDVDTMEIKYIQTGFDAAAVDALIEAKLGG